jgi:hypothetical protein
MPSCHEEIENGVRSHASYGHSFAARPAARIDGRFGRGALEAAVTNESWVGSVA